MAYIFQIPPTRVKFMNSSPKLGASKFVYQGTYDDGARDGQKCVGKFYQQRHRERLGVDAWRVDRRASQKAQEYAQQYNKLLPTIAGFPIEFLIPEITTATAESVRFFNEVIPAGASLAVEKFLEGIYTKFSSNTGSCSHETRNPSSFSHYTFDKSKGEFMVTDIKGVKYHDGTRRYEFTDPAIQSTGQPIGYYGPRDLGVFGMRKFFTKNHHTCNPVCEGQGWSKFDLALLSGIPEDVMKDFEVVLQLIVSRPNSMYTDELLQLASNHSPSLTHERINEIHGKVGAYLISALSVGAEGGGAIASS